MKRKAQQSTVDDDLSFKAGRPVKLYTIQDAVKMASILAGELSEIAILMRILMSSHVGVSQKYFTCFTNNLCYNFFRRLW